MNKLFSSLIIVLSVYLFGSSAIAQPVNNPANNIPTEVTAPPPVTEWPGIYNTSSSDQNYIRIQTPDQPEATFNANGYYRQTTQYFDGLGRPLQTVNQKGQADGYDLIQSHIYDAAGRESYQYLPYAMLDLLGNGNKFYPAMKSNVQNFYSASPGEEPYSQTIYDNSPLNRVVKQLPPGHSWVGSDRGKTFDYNTNTDITYLLNGTSPQYYNVIGSWPHYTVGNAAGALPQYAGDYENGELYITRTTDEDGKMSEEAKDKLGRVIFKRVLSQKTTGANYPAGVPADVFPINWAYTVYIYDDLGRLRYVLPPEAVKATLSNVVTDPQGAYTNHNYTYSFPNITQAVSNGLCYKYVYDARSRVVEKKLPGKAVEYFVYDKRDRQVLYQDGNLRPDGKWAFTIYDALDRPMVTGQVKSNAANRSAVQNIINNSTAYSAPNLYYYLKNYKLWHVYPASVTTAPGAGTMLSYTYYDDYSNATFSGFSFDNGQFPSNTTSTVVPSVKANNVKGRITGTKLRVLDPDHPNSNTWLMTVNYYDDNGRVIQTQSQNLHHGMDITSNLYYFQGDLYKTVIDHKNPDAKKVPGASDLLAEIKLEKTYNRNFLAKGGNNLVKNITQSINDGNPYDLAAYGYDHLNRVVTKQFTIGNELKEYNVRGFLNHIKVKDPATQNKQFFEENLYYDQGFVSKLYNGNIAGITWSGYHNGVSMIPRRAYGYSYDKMNRLTHAEFRQFKTLAPFGWSKDAYDYTASNLSYDLNGNLKSMNQRGVTTGPIDMDKLTYTYATNSNRLIKVKDGVPSANTAGLPDFKDGANVATEYTYDNNGNLITDKNKEITSISYNFLNKPEVIVVKGKGSITYVYDAAGNRLQKRVEDMNQGTTTVYDYIGNFVYKDDVIQYILNEEGRARAIADNTTLGQTKFVYDYFLKDHLGNVQSVVTAHPISPQYLAEHEIASANVEQLFFDNIPAVREGKPGSSDPDDQMAAHLVAGDPNRQVGTAIMLRVMPGDKFDISADAHYEGEYNDEGHVEAESIVSSLMSTLTGGINYDGIPLEELPENIQIIERTVGNGALPGQLNDLLEQNDDPEKPKAHLNYLVFNDEMQLVTEESGAVQVPQGAMNGWFHIEPPLLGGIHIDGSGYIIIFIDNQSIGKDVWFDNVHVEHYTSEVLEENHYMPFGLTISQEAGGNTTAQPYKYQGIFLNKDFNLETYEAKYRDLDPQIGRFREIDPKAEENYIYSPYSSMADNPIVNIDPTGDDWYRDDHKMVKYDPEVHNQDDLAKGQTYLGKTYKESTKNGNVNYRKDGSIAYSNETDAYNRMWTVSKEPGGGTNTHEIMGIITKKGVLVLPDYKNNSTTSKVEEYGYSWKNGNLFDPVSKSVISLLGTIHTHQANLQDNGASAGPSREDNTTFPIKTPNKPYFTMGYDQKLHVGYGNTSGYSILPLPKDYSTVNDLQNGASLILLIQSLKSTK